jgi:two-component system, sensor histidine kinase and response regulator
MTNVLIIDDEPKNRQLLRRFLAASGDYAIREAGSGEQGLAAAAESPPDLVICDVMMPGMDGYEVTRRLKEAAGDRFLPVVMVTALADSDSRVHGLSAGADDFLSRPIDPQELQVRVANLLALRAKELALVRRFVEHTELLRFRDEMSSMIVHDLKNPLSVIISNIEYALHAQQLEGETIEALDDSLTAGRRTLSLVGNLLDVAAMEAGRFNTKREPCCIHGIVDQLFQQRSTLAKRRQVDLRCDIPEDVFVDVDRELLLRALENVVDNAMRYVPARGVLRAWTETDAHTCVLRIGNNGPAVPRHARQMVFEKFGQGAPGVGRMNLGLGLYFFRLVAEAHGGRVWIEETPELPAVFVITLKRRIPDNHAVKTLTSGVS